MLEIMLDGVLLRGNVPYGTRGVLIIAEGGFSGWEGSPSGRRASVARPAAHGDFDMPVFKGSRVVSISGHVIARSGFDLMGFRSQLVGIGSGGEPVRISVNQHDETTYAFGRVLDCSFVDSGRADQPVGAFTIEIVCSDPRKYGESHEFSGSSVQVHHFGNFPATPVVEVQGARTGPYTITGPGGRQVTISQSLTASQRHTIDFRSRTVRRNGVVQPAAFSKFEAWAIPKNIRVPMSISAGSMTVSVTDTFM